jgi:hypothetical protein
MARRSYLSKVIIARGLRCSSRSVRATEEDEETTMTGLKRTLLRSMKLEMRRMHFTGRRLSLL